MMSMLRFLNFLVFVLAYTFINVKCKCNGKPDWEIVLFIQNSDTTNNINNECKIFGENSHRLCEELHTPNDIKFNNRKSCCCLHQFTQGQKTITISYDSAPGDEIPKFNRPLHAPSRRFRRK